MPPPLFLQALDDVLETDDGYVAACPICRDLLLVEPLEGFWRLACDGGCDHEELVRWLALDDLTVDRAYGDRLYATLMLATTPEVWKALMAADPVDPAALDPVHLRRYRALEIVS